MHLQSCYFANLDLLVYYHSRCRRRRRCLSSLLLKYQLKYRKWSLPSRSLHHTAEQRAQVFYRTTKSFYFCLLSKGPFTDINSEEVEEEIGSMYRTVLKLTKTFGDAPGPRRVADSVKSKIDKFKVHIPLLQIICNPGLRERHWEQVKGMSTLLIDIFAETAMPDPDLGGGGAVIQTL